MVEEKLQLLSSSFLPELLYLLCNDAGLMYDIMVMSCLTVFYLGEKGSSKEKDYELQAHLHGSRSLLHF